MSTMTYGSLFSGYAGLDMGVQSVLGGSTSWFCEVEAAPSKILAHHWPGTPNLGDVTKVDWASVPKVDVITGGFPCQDVSHAGKRLGLRPETRTGLWSHMAYAIDQLQPSLVVAENVRGLLSARADGDLEPCPWCVGDGERGALRALGAVLGDLAGLRYDAWWYGLRAADVGAAHGRFRVFVFAAPADSDSPGLGEHGRRVRHGNGNGHGKSLSIEAARLLPTPEAKLSDSGPDYARADRPGCGGDDLTTTIHRHLLPTPRVTDGTKGGPNQRGASGDLMLPSAVQDWREYEAAIRRQEQVFGRPAPPPTQPGAKGQPRLSPTFVEWLMGLPEGHVTGVSGLSRNDQLKALGNGVCPQQAAAATVAWAADAGAVA